MFDLCLATVTKLVQESLPSDIVVSKESLGLIIECCVEFIQLVASESNDICEGETKKTIVPEHIQTALANLGFTDYLKDVDTVIQELKQHAKTKEKKVNKFENSGLTVEELQKQQEELFEKAKQRYQTQQNSFESISIRHKQHQMFTSTHRATYQEVMLLISI